MASQEAGTCSVCGRTVTPINRTYFYYDVNCSCCNSKDEQHFEIVWHCDNCEPKPPRTITITANVTHQSPPRIKR